MICYLRWDNQELNVSGLIPSLTVCIAVDKLVNTENIDTFTTLYAVAHQSSDEDETDDEQADVNLLNSTLLLIPDALPENQDDTAHRLIVTIPEEADEKYVATYKPNTSLCFYRRYALAADYMGEGIYTVCEMK